MSQRKRNILKGWFETGDKPTQTQFSDLIDSFFTLLEDSLTIDQVENLQEALDSKAPISAVSGILQSQLVTTVDKPGIPEGTTFIVGTTIEYILNQLLAPDIVNPTTVLDTFPGNVVFTSNVNTDFDIVTCDTALIVGVEKILLTIVSDNEGNILKVDPSHYVENLDDFEATAAINAANEIEITITINSAPGDVTVKKPIIRYL